MRVAFALIAVLSACVAFLSFEAGRTQRRLDELERLQRNASTGTVHMQRLVIGGRP